MLDYQTRVINCAHFYARYKKRQNFNTLLSQKQYVEHIIWKRMFYSSDQSQQELILKIYRCRSCFRDIIDICLSNLQIAHPSMRLIKNIIVGTNIKPYLFSDVSAHELLTNIRGHSCIVTILSKHISSK